MNNHTEPTKLDLQDNSAAFASLLREARAAARLSFTDVEKSTGISRAMLHNLEQGRVATPNPTMLPQLAAVLSIPLADLYAAAGYEMPKTLPTFTPYLRSMYRDLPPEARDELSQAFERITNKYGYDHGRSGPEPGEDE